MPRPLNRIDDSGIENYDLRRSDLILRALAKGRAEFKAAYGRYPNSFYVTSVAFEDLEDSFPESHRGPGAALQRIFFGMTMRKSDSMGLTDDEFEYGD